MSAPAGWEALLPRPEATQTMASVADMMRARNLAPYQQRLLQQQTQEGQARTGLIGQQTEAASIENQMQRQLLGAYSDPEIWKAPAPAAAPSGGTAAAPVLNETKTSEASDPVSMINGLFERAAQKYNPIIAQKVVAPFLEHYKTMQDMTVKQQDVYTKAHQALGEGLAGVKTSDNIPQALADFQAELKKNPIPGLPPNELAEVENIGPEHLDATINALRFSSQVTEASSKQSAAKEAALKAEAPSDAERSTFTNKTLPSFTNMAASQRDAFAAEAENAKTRTELNAVLARADATDKAEQMHADSLRQARSLVGVKDAQKWLEDNYKNWNDPQHGYGQVASAAKLTLKAIQEGADGNGLAASMAPTMTVLGINGFNQTHRISPAEAQAAGAPGGYAERFNAWADKAFKGKLNAQVASEGKQLMNDILDAAYSRAVSGSQMAATSGGILATQMPAMDREGNITTLDKAIGPKAKAPEASLIYARDPTGKLHSAPAGTALPTGWKQEKAPQ